MARKRSGGVPHGALTPRAPVLLALSGSDPNRLYWQCIGIPPGNAIGIYQSELPDSGFAELDAVFFSDGSYDLTGDGDFYYKLIFGDVDTGEEFGAFSNVIHLIT